MEKTISVDLTKAELSIITRLLNNRLNACDDMEFRRLYNKLERKDLELHRLDAARNRTKLIVVNENTLATQHPEKPKEITVLRALATKGKTSRFFNYNEQTHFLLQDSDTVRLATPHDFDVYRIAFEGTSYCNPTMYVYNRV